MGSARIRVADWLRRPPSARTLLGLVGASLAVLVIASTTAMRPAESIAGSDVTVYATYGARMIDGDVPYRDFPMEYPAGAVVMFVVPTVFAGGSTEGATWAPLNEAGRRYYRGFESLVVLLLAAVVVLTALTLTAVGRSTRAIVLALAVVAASPLLLEQVLLERFDVWPAALTSAALAAGVRERYRIGGAILGLGAAAKIYPALLLPVLAIAALRRRGLREALLVVGVSLGALITVLVPFLVASSSGTLRALRVQFTGGLQIESLASSLLVVVGDLAGSAEYASQGAGGGLIRIDLSGPGVGVAMVMTTALLAAGLCLTWFALLHSSADREDLLRFAAATVALVLVLGAVLSPQYLVWLVPLAPLVCGRRGVAAVLLFVIAAALTNAWIPDRYFEYQGDLSANSAWLLLVRNFALLGVALVLVFPARART